MHAFTSSCRRADIAALLLACVMLAPSLAAARPVVLEEVARLTSPDPSLHLTRAVALDGNDLLVVATTFPGFPDPDYQERPVVLLHFERQSDGSWLSRGAIFSATYGDYVRQGVVLEGGLGAVFVGISVYAILERTSTGWNITHPAMIFSGSAAAVHDRTIALGSERDGYHVVHLLEKDATGAWAPALTLQGPPGFADDEFIGPDVEFVASQVIAIGQSSDAFPSPFETYVFDRMNGVWTDDGIMNGRSRRSSSTTRLD